MPHGFRNSFLRSLPPAALEGLQPHLQFGPVRWSEVLWEPDDPVNSVCFPETALVSLITSARDGSTVETTMVGGEGAAGLIEAVGSGAASARSIIQVDGDAWQAPASVWRRAFEDNAEFRRAAMRFFELQLIESRQSGLCQAVHGVERRLSRWLSESHERSAGRTVMPLTQEFMAAMLGVQRTTVTGVASLLKKSGLISYARGSLHILDPEGLNARSCECREVVREHRRRLNLAVVTGGSALPG